MAEKKNLTQAYEEMTAEELTQRFRETFFYTDEIDEMVYRELEQLQAALDKKQNTDSSQSAEEFWERFSRNHATELAQCRAAREKAKDTAKARHYRIGLRTALIAAVLFVLLAGATFAAGSFGYDLWAWVPELSDSGVRFEQIEAAAPKAMILSALEELDIHEPVYPREIPESFIPTESQFSDDPFILFEQYGDGERYISVTITPISSFDVALYQEKDEPLRQYWTGGTEHVLFSNAGTITAVWYTENYFTSVSGNISVPEMKRIIDSVYAR